MIFIYNIIRFFLYPILLIAAVFNTKFRKFFLKRLKVGKVTRDKYIWIHLSSVGELNLSEKLIEKINDLKYPIFYPKIFHFSELFFRQPPLFLHQILATS